MQNRGNKQMLARALGVLVGFAALVLAAPAQAGALEIGTTVSLVAEEPFAVTSQTEDCTLAVGGEQVLRVAVGGTGPFSYVWELSADGGTSWITPRGAADAPSYALEDAQPNTDSDGRDLAYQYRVTVTNGAGESVSAVIRVLVSDDYDYRTISLREGDTDVSAYMHDATRLVVTPLDEAAQAAQAVLAEQTPGCLPLLLCDVSLVNQNNQVVPYFGVLQIDFHVGTEYNGQTLNAYHLLDGSVDVYSEVVADGVLSIVVNRLSPFMVEVPDDSAHTVTASVSGPGGSIAPSGKVSAADGGAKTFTFLPDAGYVLSEVLVDGSPVPVTGNSVTLSDIRANGTISVRFAAVTLTDALHTLSAAVSGGHGTVSPAGEIRVRHGAAQTLYFYPDEGYELDAVTVDGVTVRVLGSSYTLSAMTDDAVVEASFRPAATQRPTVYESVALEAGPGGSVSPEGSVTVEYGGGLYVYFIPDSGYVLDKVYVDGVETAVSDGAYHLVNVVAPRSIRAIFRPAAEPTPSPSPSSRPSRPSRPGGSSSGRPSGRSSGRSEASSEPSPGTSPAASPSPTPGASPSAAPVPTPAPAVYHTVTVRVNGPGRVSPSGDLRVADGGSQTFYFLAEAGYEVDTVCVNGEERAVAAGQLTLDDIRGDVELSVSFRPAAGGAGGDGCRCLWARLFGRCALCGAAGRCVAPWCWLVPLLLAAAAGALLYHLLRRKKREGRDKKAD